MSDTDAGTGLSSAGDSDALRLVCREVWGGNRPIDVPVELPGMVGRLYSRPCDGGRGGDIHFLTTCSSGLLSRIFLADVAGHGEAVATMSALVNRTMRRFLNWHDQRSIFRRVNRELARIGFSAMTTAAAITYYPPKRRVSVSYAGHYPAWWYRRTERTWQRLDAPPPADSGPGYINLPLAAVDESTFTKRSVRADLGDRLILVTDGVIEAPDNRGEMLSMAGFETLLACLDGVATTEITDHILQTVAERVGPDLAHDDVTILVLEIVPGPSGSMLWNAVRNRLVRPRGNSDDVVFAQG